MTVPENCMSLNSVEIPLIPGQPHRVVNSVNVDSKIVSSSSFASPLNQTVTVTICFVSLILILVIYIYIYFLVYSGQHHAWSAIIASRIE